MELVTIWLFKLIRTLTRWPKGASRKDGAMVKWCVVFIDDHDSGYVHWKRFDTAVQAQFEANQYNNVLSEMGLEETGKWFYCSLHEIELGAAL